MQEILEEEYGSHKISSVSNCLVGSGEEVLGSGRYSYSSNRRTGFSDNIEQKQWYMNLRDQRGYCG